MFLLLGAKILIGGALSLLSVYGALLVSETNLYHDTLRKVDFNEGLRSSVEKSSLYSR